jgi:hypothetical protein
MIVCTILAGKLEPKESLELGGVFLASVRRAMPHARVVQVSDEKFPEVPGVDSVFRHPWTTGGWIRFRFEALASFARINGEHLFLDYDIVVRRDVSYVMKEDFEVAMCETPDRRDHILNGGVIFCKTPLLYERGRDIYFATPTLQDEWEGGQTAQDRAARSLNLKYLDFDRYNFTPDCMGAVPPSAEIVHYRGRRKRFMVKDNMEVACSPS